MRSLALLAVIGLTLAPCLAAPWGVTAEFADRDRVQSRYEAPELAQRGVNCVFLNPRGANRNWPNWGQVAEAWRDAGVSYFWDMPSTTAECDHILGFEPGSSKIDGCFLDQPFSLQIQRMSKAMARRLRRSAGYRILPGPSPAGDSYGPNALASWQRFLAEFTHDRSPGEDTNGDSRTFNSAFSSNYSTWDQVQQFTGTDLADPRKRLLAEMWLADSYAGFVEDICRGVREEVKLDVPIGPEVDTAPGYVDASMQAARAQVTAIYADGPDSAPALDCAAAAFGKPVFAAGVRLEPEDPQASRLTALRLLPYTRGACFDYSGLVAERTGENPAKIAKFAPAFRVIPELVPFAGRFDVERAPVLWILPAGARPADTGNVLDACCVSEAALALDPDSLDLGRFKAIIYRTSRPCISTGIMQKLFDYAVNGGTVFLDGCGIASGPTILGRDNRQSWWEGMSLARETPGAGETTVTFGGRKWTLAGTAPYLLPTDAKVRQSGSVDDSTGASYPLLLVRAIGKSGKWVFINTPDIWARFSLLRAMAIVKEECAVTLPDSSEARVYAGDSCALALGGEKAQAVSVKCPHPKAVAFDVFAGTARAADIRDGRLDLPGEVEPGGARLWVVKPYGEPVVLYTDGTVDYAASIDGGTYAGKALQFSFAERAYVSSPTRPSSLTVDGRPTQFRYDPEQRLVTIEKTGPAASARLEYSEPMAKTFKFKGIGDDDTILLLNLQGVVNRDGARLFYDAEGRSDWGPADRRWMEVYSQRKNLRFEPVDSMDDLVAVFADRIKGLIVFDPAIDATRYVALTMAGLEDCLAVSPAQMTGAVAKIPVKEDLRGRFSTGVEAYEWAIEHLRPRCSDSIAYSTGQSHGDVNLGHDNGIILALDYALSRKAFVFNLSPCPEPTTYNYEKEHVKGHPEDVRLMDTILDTYSPPAKIYGWNEPEWKFTSRISGHGHMLMCGRGANLSFHQHVPCDTTRFKQVADTRPRPGPVENKYYLAFMTNEGDTPRVFTTFFFGAWEDADRGSFPMNWGISPTLIADFPAIAEYYYSTATANDYFYAGVSGTGYSFIDQLPDVGVFARFGRPRFEAADIDIADAWDEFEFHPERYETYAKEAGIRFFTLLPRGESGVRMLSCGVPVFVPHAKVHYKGGDPESRVRSIEEIAQEVKPPFLIPLYGGLSKNTFIRCKKIVESLDPRKFEFITLARMAGMAKEMCD